MFEERDRARWPTKLSGKLIIEAVRMVNLAPVTDYSSAIPPSRRKTTDRLIKQRRALLVSGEAARPVFLRAAYFR